MSVAAAATPQRGTRSLLFVPGNRADMLAKATRYPAHAFIPDLEDSVPEAEKDRALDEVVRALPALASTGRLVIPRLNSLGTGRFDAELEALAGPHTAAISVGKIRSAQEIRRVDLLLARLEAGQKLKFRIGIVAWIETAAALASVTEICRASDRIRWVAFGAEDLTADMGVPRDAGGLELPLLQHARATVAIAARAIGAIAADTPFVRFKDSDGLIEECRRSRHLGFKAKFAIHPSQVEAINRVFGPTDAELAHARRVIAAWESAASEGRGAISLDGEMVDVPVVSRARAILAEADPEPGRS